MVDVCGAGPAVGPKPCDRGQVTRLRPTPMKCEDEPNPSSDHVGHNPHGTMAVRPTTRFPYRMRVAAAFGWRLLVLLAVGYVALQVRHCCRVRGGGPVRGDDHRGAGGATGEHPHNVFAPRISVAVGLVVVVAAIVGVFVFIGTQVAEQWEGLTPVPGGHRRDPAAGGRPPASTADAITEYAGAARTWIIGTRATSPRPRSARRANIVEGFTGFALAIFASVFFPLGGREIWAWMVGLFPVRQRGRIDGVGQVAWVRS